MYINDFFKALKTIPEINLLQQSIPKNQEFSYDDLDAKMDWKLAEADKYQG